MNVSKKLQLVSLFLIVFSISACANPKQESSQTNTENSAKKQTQVKKTVKGTSPLQTELDQAKAAGKAVFVVVTGTGVTDLNKAMSIAKGANALYKNATVIQMNKDLPVNETLVNEWRLSGAPVPLILVLSSKGLPTGGYTLAEATSENIAALVPTPKLEMVYDAISQAKHAVVAFTKQSFTDRSEVVKECNKAVALLKNEAVFVEVDMNDVKESNFMKQLQIDNKTAKSSITLVINKQGQVAGTSTSIPDAQKLATAATTPVSGGCGTGCGPAGCSK